MLDVIWMDHDTLAERLGIERESARQRAKRGQWARRKDNTGKMQVGVPAEVLEAPPERLPDCPSERVHEPNATTDVNAVLTRHIERLEQALETAQEKSEALERERIAGEQARVEKWKAVADRFASQAERLTEAPEARRGWWPWRKRA